MAMTGAAALEVRRSRGSRLALGVAAALAVLVLVGWFVTHPSAPATSDTDLRASVPVGGTVYLGVYTPDADGGHALHLARVDVRHTGTAVVGALVCRGGALGVTTAPKTFCRDLVRARGATLSPGDQLVVRVTSGTEGTVRLSRPRVSYRDGVQWGTREAGHPARISVLSR